MTVYGAPRLKTEIEFWLQARSLAADEQYRAAQSVYENAWRTSEERGDPHPSVLFERGVLADELANYEQALGAFEGVLIIDEGWEADILEIIASRPEMQKLWSMNQNEYPGLSGFLPTLTPTLTPTNTPVPPTVTDTLTPTDTSEPPPTVIVPPSPPHLVMDGFGVPMVLIPEGSFEMGSEDGEEDEKPVHTVQLGAFFMDQFEVTNARYAECVETGKCVPPWGHDSYTRKEYYENIEFANYPGIYINWQDAQTYCHWRDARLPTEAEWEKAARGGFEQALYPWGNENPVCDPGAINGAQFNDFDKCFATDTEQVGSYGANGYGLYDMAGNVWEWTADWYEVYPDGDPTTSDYFGKQYRVLRGGSWDYDVSGLRLATRGLADPDYISSYSIGFRCVRDAAQMQNLMP